MLPPPLTSVLLGRSKGLNEAEITIPTSPKQQFLSPNRYHRGHTFEALNRHFVLFGSGCSLFLFIISIRAMTETGTQVNNCTELHSEPSRCVIKILISIVGSCEINVIRLFFCPRTSLQVCKFHFKLPGRNVKSPRAGGNKLCGIKAQLSATPTFQASVFFRRTSGGHEVISWKLPLVGPFAGKHLQQRG